MIFLVTRDVSLFDGISKLASRACGARVRLLASGPDGCRLQGPRYLPPEFPVRVAFPVLCTDPDFFMYISTVITSFLALNLLGCLLLNNILHIAFCLVHFLITFGPQGDPIGIGQLMDGELNSLPGPLCIFMCASMILVCMERLYATFNYQVYFLALLRKSVKRLKKYELEDFASSLSTINKIMVCLVLTSLQFLMSSSGPLRRYSV